MNWFKKIFNKENRENVNEKSDKQGASGGNYESANNPTAHHVVLEYLRVLWSGGQADKEFENKSLSKDLNFNLLNLAELIFAVCKERNWNIDRAIDYTTIFGVGSGAPLSMLLTRVKMLADVAPTDKLRFLLLDSGIVGDKKEIIPVTPYEEDPVFLILPIIKGIEAAMSKTDHEAIDQEFGYVE